MNEHQLLELTRKGEGLDPEFKTCRNQISRDVYETVCAFLNRHGGTILLGVQDSGEETVTPKVTPEVGTKLALSRHQAEIQTDGERASGTGWNNRRCQVTMLGVTNGLE